jgi:hypothetical protein
VKRAWDEVMDPIAALRKEIPRSKTGFIRRALPEIQAALAEGHSLKAIWQRFREAGFDVEYKHFCTYVGRARSERRVRAGSKAESGRSTGRLVSANIEKPGEAIKHDPLANLRRVEAKGEVFEYRGTQDLEELVYGAKEKSYKKQ